MRFLEWALLFQSVKRFMSFISKAAIIRKMLQQKSVASQFQQHARIIGDRIHLAVFNSTQI